MNRKKELDELLAGTPYRARRELGRGGMGLVVEAERVDLGRRVAVKVLHAHLSMDEGLVDRLRIEAQTLGRIQSPHVVQVLDLGRTKAGRPFLAMEYLDGCTLRDELRDAKPLVPTRALDIADQALRGLGAAHALGVVHRDVKPENLFLSKDDGKEVVKVLDFGVAKVLRAGGGIAPPMVPTDEGVTVGTPRYLAPEQVIGSAAVDARIDLYAMGLILWAMLAGRVPFHEVTDAVELAKLQIRGAPLPAPSTFVPGLPAAIDALIERASAKDKHARFPDAEAFRRAIAAARAALLAAPKGPPQIVTAALDPSEPSTIPDPKVAMGFASTQAARGAEGTPPARPAVGPARIEDPGTLASAGSTPSARLSARGDLANRPGSGAPGSATSDLVDPAPRGSLAAVGVDPAGEDPTGEEPTGRSDLVDPVTLVDPATQADGPPEVETTTLDASTHPAGPPEAPTTVLPHGEPTVTPATRRMPSGHLEPRTIAMPYLRDPAPPFPAPGLVTPTPPPVAAAIADPSTYSPSPARTFALVLLITVLVLGAVGAGFMLLGLGELATSGPPPQPAPRGAG